MLWLAVALGAAVGAPVRFAIDRATIAKWGTRWPYGTFIVNSVGSLTLGLVTGMSAAAASSSEELWKVVSALVGVGFCGALTTFSGWASQLIDLTAAPQRWRGAGYAGVSLVVGLALASLGYVVGFAVG